MPAYLFDVPEKKKCRVIIDSDTACEADDPFAIAYALLSPKLIIRGIVAEHFAQPRHARLHLAHAVSVALLRRREQRRGLRVVSVSEDVVLPFLVLAGELHPAQKTGIVRAPEGTDDPAAFHFVVVRYREQAQSGLLRA